ncbi:MAG: hypothetical protein KDA96_19700, partial [Planctomycetaceae bacterium]|nr:hypothetical protein [Planctomycetaceae bacterium]
GFLLSAFSAAERQHDGNCVKNAIPNYRMRPAAAGPTLLRGISTSGSAAGSLRDRSKFATADDTLRRIPWINDAVF